MKKKIGLVLSVIVLIGIVTFSLTNTKKELKVEDISKDRLAVFVKQEDGSYKTVNQIPSIGYVLNIDKSTCSNGAKPIWSNNALNLANLTSSNTNCYLYFDDDAATKKLKELGLTANTTTPDFSQAATTDEGIFGVEDGMYGGTSYYWRGAVTTNYVRFAGFCWRAIRINGDGSLRLIYDGSTCHQNGESTTDSIAVSNVAYNTSANQSNYVGWTYEGQLQRPTNNAIGTASNAKTQLESWYNSNIVGTNAEKVAYGKFCNDRNVGQPYSRWSGYVTTWSTTGTQFAYAGVDRLWNKYLPILSCSSSDIYILSVGSINADEVEYAGGNFDNNNQYYLYNGQSYWTISPQRWDNNVFVFAINYNGNISSASVSSNASMGIRPVINLRSDVTFTGNGTIDNPFVVEGAE